MPLEGGLLDVMDDRGVKYVERRIPTSLNGPRRFS